MTIFLGSPPCDRNRRLKKRFAADRDASFGEKVFDEWSGTPAMAEIESIVQPDCVSNDIWRESVGLASIHEPILSISAS